MSLRSGRVPDDWKLAIVTPVPKRRPPKCVRDFRPVSLLNIISKVLERHVKEILGNFMGNLSDQQFGFRCKRSTTDCLANFTHDVAVGLNHHTKVGVVFFDVKSAFDSVPHSQLLHHLQSAYSVPPSILRWLSSYLSQRRFRVRVEEELSDERPAPSGVPQGSCIAADLFICYIDSIAKLDFSTGTKLYLYADDACRRKASVFH